jgi:hypothetical protein
VISSTHLIKFLSRPAAHIKHALATQSSEERGTSVQPHLFMRWYGHDVCDGLAMMSDDIAMTLADGLQEAREVAVRERSGNSVEHISTLEV